MAMHYKIGAMLFLLFLYSSQSISATANNVKCNGCIGSKDLKNNAVTSSKIKKNAVTGSKIKAGAVTRDKLGSDVDTILDNVGDNFSMINDNDQRITNLENANTGGVVEVGSSSGASYPDPLTAMADLATWCGTPSAANPCLMKILPGVYDLGATPLTMVAYVDIAGSGENVTRLIGSDQVAFASGTVVGASNSRLSNLTVENIGGGTRGHGIYSNADFVVEHVTVTVSGAATSGNRGVYAAGGVGMFVNVTISVTGPESNYGFNTGGGTQTIVNSAITVSGEGSARNNSGVLFNNAGSTIIRGSTVSVSGTKAYGIHPASGAGSATVQFSVIEGDVSAAQMDAAFTLSASHSQLIGGVTAVGTRTCVFVADGSLSALDAACQEL